ncbi:MAG TPA: NAD-dependent DNA ligase LigA [Myxococcota bacterium]|nr:NAD-dependent DNA ligase LigA [Myxococcota bacterium]
MRVDQKVLDNSKELLEKLASLSERQLSRLIIYHNRKYFEENKPEITDEAFDKLVEALRFLNPDARALQKIGHQIQGGADRRFLESVVHQQPMLSLEKCYDDNSLLKWAAKINGDFVAMPKIDGVASSITYSVQGNLMDAATRGDGRVGENITINAMLIGDLPKQLPATIVKSLAGKARSIEVRGEIFLPISQFNQKFAESFTSPRNLAAGFLKLKEGDRSRNHFLRFFPYDLRGSTAKSEHEKFIVLEELGFSMMPWKLVQNDGAIAEIYYDFLAQRTNFDFEIDGVVYRADSLSEQLRLGETAHHPRFAMAYKFQGETAQTKVLKVEWSVARSGIITPVAIVEPVFASGAMISRVSLHNLHIFRELDLREESLVEIKRRGGVIPYLERVLSRKGEPLPVPNQCPSCGGPVVVEGDFLRCKNPNGCEEVAVSRLIHFSHVLDIEGLGEKIIRKLYQAGFIEKFGDIFRLNVDMLISLPRMGIVLARKLLQEISSKKTVGLVTFIQALGIREIGANIAELLANNFHTLEAIIELQVEDLLPIHGVGISIATSLVDGLLENKEEIDDLLKEITVENEEIGRANLDQAHPFYSKSVLFTGKMAHLERKAAQDAVRKLGGKAPGAMSKAVDYLVIGDEGSPLLGPGKMSTKHKEAEKIISEGGHIKIISETEFLRMIKK